MTAFVSNGLPHVVVPLGTNAYTLVDLEASSDLRNWSVSGRFRRGILPFADLSAPAARGKYFRAREFSGASDWTSQAVEWGKFTFFADRPDNIYFHSYHLFHYQFARQNLPEFADYSAEAFDEVAIHPSRQRVVLGGMIWTGKEVVVSFVNVEPFQKDRLVSLFKAVAARIVAPAGQPIVLEPSNYDRDQIMAEREYFEEHGVPVRPRTLFSRSVHSAGQAMGTLKYASFEDLVSGLALPLLTPDTILVTDYVPRDLPPIAGLISLNASPANSHSVLRLQALGRPYVDASREDITRVTNLLGKAVLFTALQEPADYFLQRPVNVPPSWKKSFLLEDVSTFGEAVRAELSRRFENQPVEFPRIQRLGKYSEQTTNLFAPDLGSFGSKAVNYGILQRKLPQNCVPAIAFSFDLWLEFMGQKLASGKTLREEIAARLTVAETNLASTLAGQMLRQARDLIEDQAIFTEQQKAAITNALAGFDPKRKIRFRSSSNVEDLPRFSAAGLHESHSGCLLDDLQSGPADVCECDATDDKRRGVFRAIKKVFASFYNDQAFAERHQYGIDESKVGMALLVHHSFPDEIELANGVATADFYISTNSIPPQISFMSGRMVTQRGADSVANPEGVDLPEIVELNSSGAASFLAYSTIRPPNTAVLFATNSSSSEYTLKDEYYRFCTLFKDIGTAFPWTNYPGVSRLNFEYKKVATNARTRLVLKQVRPVYGEEERLGPAIFKAETGTLYTIQENSGLGSQSIHGQKIILHFASGESIADSNDIQTGALFSKATAVYVSGGKIVTNELNLKSSRYVSVGSKKPAGYWGAMSGEFALTTNVFQATDGTVFHVSFAFPFRYSIRKPPLVPSDARILCSREGLPGAVQLAPRMATVDLTVRKWAHSFETNGVGVETIYWRHESAYVPIGGLGPTEALWDWERTTITGLTREPIVLKGYFSQTYLPSRHNIIESVLLEPRLEQGISPEQIAELEQKDVRQIYASFGAFVFDPNDPIVQRRDQIELIGASGVPRTVPPNP